jgi:uncharacterized membrane protein (DUF485 family)
MIIKTLLLPNKSPQKPSFMLHEHSNHEMGPDKAAEKKSKLGVKLFLIYTAIYFGFVIIGVFFSDLMGVYIIGGQNLAVVYGFGLIILAIIMGFIYNAMCTRLENKMNGGEE